MPHKMNTDKNWNHDVCHRKSLLYFFAILPTLTNKHTDIFVNYKPCLCIGTYPRLYQILPSQYPPSSLSRMSSGVWLCEEDCWTPRGATHVRLSPILAQWYWARGHWRHPHHRPFVSQHRAMIRPQRSGEHVKASTQPFSKWLWCLITDIWTQERADYNG